MEQWSPGDVIAVVAVLTVAASQVLQWRLAVRRMQHESELQGERAAQDLISRRTDRSDEAARALLDTVDRMHRIFRPVHGHGVGPDSEELRPVYEDLRRRIPEILDPEARAKLEQAADVFYYWSGIENVRGTYSGRSAYVAARAAREALGAVLRGERAPELPELKDLYEAHLEYEEWQRDWHEQRTAARRAQLAAGEEPRGEGGGHEPH